MKVQFRPYCQSDKGDLLNIFQRNVPNYFDELEKDEFSDYLDVHGSSYLVLEINNRIIGGTGYQINLAKATGSITWIFLDPNYTGKGIGKLAVEYCHNILKSDSNLRTFSVRTAQFTFEFFEKMGYKIIHFEKDYWARGYDLYEMEMIL